MNPLQHPSFCDNIHHLEALLTALSHSCGGLVFLTTDEINSQKKIQFSTFTSQRLSTSNSLETSQLAIQGNVWAVIAVKRSAVVARYELNGYDREFKIDISGQVHNVSSSEEQPNSVENAKHEGAFSKPDADVDFSADSTVVSQLITEPQDGFDDSSELPVDLSTVRELNWDQNKENWENILRKPDQSVAGYLNSCEFLEPQIPMQITPDKDSVRYLFPSDTKFNETLDKLATKTPGFAIVSRSWLSLLPAFGTMERPPNHLCDILTVSMGEGLDVSKPNIRFWVLVSGSKELIIQRQVQYMFKVGRMIKHQIAKQNETTESREVLNLTIRCMLHSIQDEDSSLVERTLHALGIESTQDFLRSVYIERNTFDAVKRSIGLLLLSQDSHIKNCAGEQMSVKLSAVQARTLLQIRRKRISYISSAPGTGKTLCGLTLYRDFGKERSVYICPAESLLHYLKYNGCEGTLVRNNEELRREINQGSFNNKRCVIIDESHRMRCSKECLAELF